MKAIKITPSGIKLIDSLKGDEDYMNYTQQGVALDLPTKWKHNKYRLTMFVKDAYSDDERFNPFASYLYSNLSCHASDDELFGSVFICNETSNKIVDFTIDDLKYLIQMIKT